MAKAWMPLYVADYLADTGHLDNEEHGVYLLAIMHYWQTEKPLPVNVKQLLSICRCFDSAKFEQIWSTVSTFFHLTEFGWVHERIEFELNKSHNITEKRKIAGSIGGEKRVANAKQMLEQLPTQSQSQSQSQSEPKKESKSSRFTPPTIEEVKAYCEERNRGVNADKWMNHYMAKGWKVGSAAMKDWKAAVRTWESDAVPPQSKAKEQDHRRYL